MSCEVQADETAWLEKLRQGDVYSFEQLVYRYEKRIYAMCYRAMLSRSDAEDLTQDVFLSIYKSLPQFRGDANIYTWIYRIALNKVLNAKRSKRPLPYLLDSHGPPEDVKARDALTQRENALDIASAVGRLPEKYRAIIELYYYQDCLQKDIADILRLPLKTVETRLLRARAKLKEHLEKLGYSEEDLNG